MLYTFRTDHGLEVTLNLREFLAKMLHFHAVAAGYKDSVEIGVRDLFQKFPGSGKPAVSHTLFKHAEHFRHFRPDSGVRKIIFENMRQSLALYTESYITRMIIIRNLSLWSTVEFPCYCCPYPCVFRFAVNQDSVEIKQKTYLTVICHITLFSKVKVSVVRTETFWRLCWIICRFP